MRQLQDDHHRTMESLQRQLETTENQLYRAQKEIQRNNSMVVVPTRTPVETSKESPLESTARTVPGEREQAEVCYNRKWSCPVNLSSFRFILSHKKVYDPWYANILPLFKGQWRCWNPDTLWNSLVWEGTPHFETRMVYRSSLLISFELTHLRKLPKFSAPWYATISPVPDSEGHKPKHNENNSCGFCPHPPSPCFATILLTPDSEGHKTQA